jgi:hypothetical protein
MTTDLEEALETLHKAGLVAQPSKIVPGGIGGGIQRLVQEDGSALHLDGFWILPEEGTYIAAVPGPGNGCVESMHRTLAEAARAIVVEYTTGWRSRDVDYLAWRQSLTPNESR